MSRPGHSAGAGRVLVVEDDEGIREMLKYNLSTAGFSVQEASDGAASRAPIESPMTTSTARAPAARRLASLARAWFKLRSSMPISLPIHVTGCPIARTSRSG